MRFTTIHTQETETKISNVYDDGCLRVEHENYYVAWNGKILRPTRAEFLIISRLVKTPERIVPSQELWKIVWGSGKKYNPLSMKVYVYHIRSLLEPLGAKIENMPNVGYRFIPCLKSK